MVKVSPDEDSEAQIRGIADAVWASGVDGVIVGNTTKRRYGLLPADHNVSAKEAAVLSEQGGYSGPQLFERTLKLVRRYRRILDDQIYWHASTKTSSPPQPASNPISSTKTSPPSQQQQQQTPQTDPDSSPDSKGDDPLPPSSTTAQQPHPARKVIFATGGITSGAQALEVLAAGASVAQVYTALVYGGAGTITRMKRELREAIERAAAALPAKKREREG